MPRIVSGRFQNQTKFEQQLESKTVLIQIADAASFHLRSSTPKFAVFTWVK
jgi:hypothetical protein